MWANGSLYKKECFSIRQVCFAADFWRIVPEKWTWISITNGWSHIMSSMLDPDLAFQVNTDPDTDPDPWFWWAKIENNTADVFFTFFLSKIAIFLSLGLHKGRPSYRRNLQPSKENIYVALQKLKFINFFSIFVGHFCPPGSRSGSRDPTESVPGSGSTTLPTTFGCLGRFGDHSCRATTFGLLSLFFSEPWVEVQPWRKMEQPYVGSPCPV